MEAMFIAATKGLQQYIPDGVSKDCKDFLSKCLVVNPKKREKAEKLLKVGAIFCSLLMTQHPWVSADNLGKGISEILKQVFLRNQMVSMGI